MIGLTGNFQGPVNISERQYFVSLEFLTGFWSGTVMPFRKKCYTVDIHAFFAERMPVV